MNEVWNYSVQNVLYFNAVVFVLSCLASWLISLILCRRKKEALKKEIKSNRGYFHHVDVDDIEYQKLMLFHDERHRNLPESIKEFKTNKIETYFSMAHLEDVKTSPNFESTSIYDVRVRTHES